MRTHAELIKFWAENENSTVYFYDISFNKWSVVFNPAWQSNISYAVVLPKCESLFKAFINGKLFSRGFRVNSKNFPIIDDNNYNEFSIKREINVGDKVVSKDGSFSVSIHNNLLVHNAIAYPPLKWSGTVVAKNLILPSTKNDIINDVLVMGCDGEYVYTKEIYLAHEELK